MKKDVKIRICFFIGLMVLLFLATIFFSRNMLDIKISGTFFKGVEESSPSILGFDLSKITNFLLDTADNILLAIIYIINYVGIILFSLVYSTLMRIIGLKNTSVITEAENNITKKIFIVGFIISIVIGILEGRFITIVPTLIFIAIWAFLVFFVYINYMDDNVEKAKETTLAAVIDTNANNESENIMP